LKEYVQFDEPPPFSLRDPKTLARVIDGALLLIAVVYMSIALYNRGLHITPWYFISSLEFGWSFTEATLYELIFDTTFSSLAALFWLWASFYLLSEITLVVFRRFLQLLLVTRLVLYPLLLVYHQSTINPTS
jgi:hypothetical protein